MSILFYGAALFTAAFLIHFTIWKIHLPTHQKSILLVIFITFLLGGVVVLFLLKGSVVILGIMPPQTLPEYLQLCIFFVSLGLAYMVTYSALEADSPSLVMVMSIAKTKKDGLEENIFKQKINDEKLLIPRIHDLVSEKLAYIEEGKYRLTPKGLMFARLFMFYRISLLRRPQKGG